MRLILGMVCWGGAREDLELTTISSYVGAIQRARKVGVDAMILPYPHEPNSPLGARHNAMLRDASRYSPDAFILAGSDDWMEEDCFIKYARWCEEGPLHALARIYIGQASTGRIVSIRSPAIGVGRMVRRDVLSRCNWRLWDDKLERHLDSSMARTVLMKWPTSWQMHGRNHNEEIVDAIDIKTAQNLWSFDRFATRGQTVGVDERDALFAKLSPTALARLQETYPEFKP